MTAAERTKAIRTKTGKSQKAFAETYGIPITTVRNWEQGIAEPPIYVLNLLEKAVEADLKNGTI